MYNSGTCLLDGKLIYGSLAQSPQSGRTLETTYKGQEGVCMFKSPKCVFVVTLLD